MGVCTCVCVVLSVQDAATTCNYNHHHHHYRPDRSCPAQCSNQGNLHKGPPFPLPSPYASCIDCCIVLWSSYLVDDGGGGCSCMLLVYWLVLMLALTSGACVLTCAACACGVSPLSTGAIIPLAQVVGVTSCNLRWYRTWCVVLWEFIYCQFSCNLQETKGLRKKSV